jgi:Protein of unknown function (DUF3096)
VRPVSEALEDRHEPERPHGRPRRLPLLAQLTWARADEDAQPTVVWPLERHGYRLRMQLGLIALTAQENRQLIAGIVSLGTGVLIFLVPRLLNYIVAAYLIVVGILLILEATD